MKKYELLSSDDDEKTQSKNVGLTPFFVLIFLIITGGVGLYVTYEKIRRKSLELGNYSTKAFITHDNINKINNILIGLINQKKENEKRISSFLSKQNILKKSIDNSKRLNFNYSNQIKKWDDKIQEDKKLLDETIQINEISKKETVKLYKSLSKSIKKYKSLQKINSEILDSDSEIDLIENWIESEENKFNYKINKCYEFLNETLDFNKTLKKYYENCIEKNKNINGSLLILYQTIYYNRIGAFIKNKGLHDEQTNFVFNLKNKIKYDIADNLIQINNKTFPSFGLLGSQGPYDIRVFHTSEKNTIQLNTTIIREDEVRNTNLLHIEIFILS